MNELAQVIPLHPTPRQLVSLAELRGLFSFSERWWRYRIAEGMPTHRWAGSLRFDPAEVRAWLDRQPSAVGSQHQKRPRTASGGRGQVTPIREVQRGQA